MVIYAIPDKYPKKEILAISLAFPNRVSEDVIHQLFGKSIKKTRKVRGAVYIDWTCAGCTCDCESRKCKIGGFPL